LWTPGWKGSDAQAERKEKPGRSTLFCWGAAVNRNDDTYGRGKWQAPRKAATGFLAKVWAERPQPYRAHAGKRRANHRQGATEKT